MRFDLSVKNQNIYYIKMLFHVIQNLLIEVMYDINTIF